MAYAALEKKNIELEAAQIEVAGMRVEVEEAKAQVAKAEAESAKVAQQERTCRHRVKRPDAPPPVCEMARVDAASDSVLPCMLHLDAAGG